MTTNSDYVLIQYDYVMLVTDRMLCLVSLVLMMLGSVQLFFRGLPKVIAA